MATIAEIGISNPTGASINVSTGALTLSLNGGNFVIGQLYAIAVSIEDGQSKTIIDFLVKVVGSSLPPYFNYGLTPNNSFIYTLNPGTNLSFTVEADDDDLGALFSTEVVRCDDLSFTSDEEIEAFFNKN